MFRHPKYYKELRKRNKLDRVISRGDATAAGRRAPDPGLKQQASSSKLRYTPTGILMGVDLGPRPQAKPEPELGSEDSSVKHQALKLSNQPG